MIFGLGGGLGFIYWSRKAPSLVSEWPFIGGRARDLDKTLCANLGVTVKVHKTASRAKAYESLKELIRQDIPVMIHVDMPQLKYQGLPEQAHFGAHVVVVAGLDEDKGIAYIADTMFKGLQTATLKELEAARSSKFKPFPPENKWFTFEFPSKLTPVKDAIRNAVLRTSRSMLYPPIKNLGVKGIYRFAGEIVNWPKLWAPQNGLFRQLYEVQYIMMEEDGTGGGLFRLLHSRFLKEAGELLSNRQLIDLSQSYLTIAGKWTKVAKLIKEMPGNPAGVHEARKTLLEIAKEETEALSSLAKIFE